MDWKLLRSIASIIIHIDGDLIFDISYLIFAVILFVALKYFNILNYTALHGKFVLVTSFLIQNPLVAISIAGAVVIFFGYIGSLDSLDQNPDAKAQSNWLVGLSKINNFIILPLIFLYGIYRFSFLTISIVIVFLSLTTYQFIIQNRMINRIIKHYTYANLQTLITQKGWLVDISSTSAFGMLLTPIALFITSYIALGLVSSIIPIFYVIWISFFGLIFLTAYTSMQGRPLVTVQTPTAQYGEVFLVKIDSTYVKLLDANDKQIILNSKEIDKINYL